MIKILDYSKPHDPTHYLKKEFWDKVTKVQDFPLEEIEGKKNLSDEEYIKFVDQVMEITGGRDYIIVISKKYIRSHMLIRSHFVELGKKTFAKWSFLRYIKIKIKFFLGKFL